MLFVLTLMIVQIYLLSAHGQTIGKKLVGVRIVKQETEENGGFLTNIVMRSILPGIIGSIPFLGLFFSIVNLLFIFREDRRCLHDLIAGTIVVSKS